MWKTGSARTRLRQIAVVAKDLEKTKDLLTTVIGTEVIFVDPGVAKWGLNNFLIAIGGDVIEVCSPFEAGTTAGRVIDKRGDGGYMIIMQTMNAEKRRAYIESKGLSKVIYSYQHDDVHCIQYHPKGIKGGMMPELDSHGASPEHPDPLSSTFSPWHAAGADYGSYSAGMKRRSDLHLIGAVCRLGSGDTNTEAALSQWEELFGLPRDLNQLVFTNARMGFVKGTKGQPDGLVSITIAVEGEERLAGIVQRARERGVWDEGFVKIVNLKWFFVLAGEGRSTTPQGGRYVSML